VSTNVEHLIKEHGDFQGSEMDVISLEIFMSKFWTRDQIKKAIDSSHNAWFDYRMVHPAMRVLYFAHEYERGRSRGFKKFLNRKRIQLPASPYTAKSLKGGKTAMLINTMLIVDEMSIPYPIFFDAVIENLLQKAGYSNNWDKTGWGDLADGIPILSHMRHSESVLEASKAFELQSRTRLHFPKHPAFQIENWSGTTAQKDCVAWLCAQARRRGRDMPYALNQMIIKGYLNEREVLRRFGPDMVKTIRAIE